MIDLHKTHAWREWRASLEGARRCRLKGFHKPMLVYLNEAAHWRREYLSLCRFNASITEQRVNAKMTALAESLKGWRSFA